MPEWLIGLLGGLLTGILASTTAVWVAYRKRLADLDQSVHDKRLECYPLLVQATGRLAVHFPETAMSGGSITPSDCEAMGRSMSAWYFTGGGLLLSTEARDAYFTLMRALTRASLAEALLGPIFPKDAADISVEKLDSYRTVLRQRNLDDVESWAFGTSRPENTSAGRFSDYVFLQRLSSQLRTALAQDLRSRRRPV